MKISTLVWFILIIGIVIFTITQASDDLNSQYSSNQINLSTMEGKFDYTSNINSSASKLKNSFDNIADPDTGFFSKIGSGIVAIPYAVILFPSLAFTAVAGLGSMATYSSDIIGIPIYIQGIILIGIVFLAIKALLDFFNRTES